MTALTVVGLTLMIAALLLAALVAVVRRKRSAR
jgi:hypothetical protein